MPAIFISHTHSDEVVADALAKLMESLFGSGVKVNYSSRKDLEGGIAPGADWFRWIVDQVRSVDVAFILLTPASLQKPWVIWEAGAVAGAASATSQHSADTNAPARVLPIMFGVRSSDLPDFFSRTQVVSGTEDSDVMKLTEDLFARFSGSFSAKQMKQFGAAQTSAVASYLERVREILLKLPHVVTEAGIQEWMERLDEMNQLRRYSEASVLENWLDAAFGRDAKDKQRPLDVRIHRRLGEMYAAADRPGDAARQFELARRLAPRDIFILRRLGKSYLDKDELEQTRAVLETIEALDPRAFETNIENAALKARLHEKSNNLVAARDLLIKALESNPTSYYLGDLLGQALLALGDTERAKETYQRVQTILRDLREQNVWTQATALTAALVCEDEAAAARALREIRDVKPTRGELESIERGVNKVITVLGRGDEVLDSLRSMERDRRDGK